MKEYIDGAWVVPSILPETSADAVAIVTQTHANIWLWWALGRFYGQEATEGEAKATAESVVRTSGACLNSGYKCPL